MLGRSSHARLPDQGVAVAQPLRRHEHRRLEPRADVVEPRLQLGGRPALVAVDDGGDEVAGLDDGVAPVVAPGELAELGADPVDERVDVLGEHPGHGGSVPSHASPGRPSAFRLTRWSSPPVACHV